MPNYGDADATSLTESEPYFVITDWEKLPYPQTWADLEAGVDVWLDKVWGADWQCPHCHNRYWGLLEAVGLDSAPWPIEDSSSYGSYPAIPVFCTRCRSIFPVVLFAIFEKPPDDSDNQEQSGS
jgi:hypothetical protein